MSDDQGSMRVHVFGSHTAFMEGSSLYSFILFTTQSPGKWRIVTMIRIDYKCTQKSVGRDRVK